MTGSRCHLDRCTRNECQKYSEENHNDEATDEGGEGGESLTADGSFFFDLGRGDESEIWDTESGGKLRTSWSLSHQFNFKKWKILARLLNKSEIKRPSSVLKRKQSIFKD